MVEQEIARAIAQHLMQRRPRQRRVERRVEKLLDPGGVEVLGRAIPGAAQWPYACRVDCGRGGAASRTTISRVIVLHSAGALSRASLACHLPAAGFGDLRKPGIRRTAVPLARCGCDPSVGCDQRELAVERLLGRKHDAQGRTPPRLDRRGQDRELGRVLAGAGPALGLCVPAGKRTTKDMPAIGSNAVTAAASRRARNKTPSLQSPLSAFRQYCEWLWLNHGIPFAKAPGPRARQAA